MSGDIIAPNSRGEDTACPRWVRLSWASEPREVRLFASDGAYCRNLAQRKLMEEE